MYLFLRGSIWYNLNETWLIVIMKSVRVIAFGKFDYAGTDSFENVFTIRARTRTHAHSL